MGYNYKLPRPNARSHDKYTSQQIRVGYKGIKMLMSFEEWHNWWLSNGIDKNFSQGPFTGDTLVMCRINDTGHYSLDNIYCATSRQNVLDKKRQGWAGKTGFAHNRSKAVGVPEGIFGSIEEAAKALKVDPGTIKYRINKGKPGYYFL